MLRKTQATLAYQHQLNILHTLKWCNSYNKLQTVIELQNMHRRLEWVLETTQLERIFSFHEYYIDLRISNILWVQMWLSCSYTSRCRPSESLTIENVSNYTATDASGNGKCGPLLVKTHRCALHDDSEGIEGNHTYSSFLFCHPQFLNFEVTTGRIFSGSHPSQCEAQALSSHLLHVPGVAAEAAVQLHQNNSLACRVRCQRCLQNNTIWFLVRKVTPLYNSDVALISSRSRGRATVVYRPIVRSLQGFTCRSFGVHIPN